MGSVEKFREKQKKLMKKNKIKIGQIDDTLITILNNNNNKTLLSLLTNY